MKWRWPWSKRQAPTSRVCTFIDPADGKVLDVQTFVDMPSSADLAWYAVERWERPVLIEIDDGTE